MTAEPEPQDVEEARVALEVASTGMAKVWPTERVYPAASAYERAVETLIAAIRAAERTRWAEREKELVGWLGTLLATASAPSIGPYRDDFIAAWNEAQNYLASLNQEGCATDG